jgi:hypothetical protein
MVMDQVLLEFPKDHSPFNVKAQEDAQNRLVARYNTISEQPETWIHTYSNSTWAHEVRIALFEKDSRKALFLLRLSFALFGGLALIAPMLIMTLHQTKLTALLTTSIFVTAVAVVLAYVMEDAQNKDIVAATAAYTAVLVVFVGTAMTPAASSGA